MRGCSRSTRAAVPAGCVALAPGRRPRARALRRADRGRDRARARPRAVRRRRRRGRRRPRHRARRRRRPLSSRWTTRSCRPCSTWSRRPRRARRSCTTRSPSPPAARRTSGCAPSRGPTCATASSFTTATSTAAWAQADVVVEETYRTAAAQHAAMEPHACVARWDGDRLEVFTGTQTPFNLREELARIFGLAPDRVRVVVPADGRLVRGEDVPAARRRSPRRSRGRRAARSSSCSRAPRSGRR